MHRGILRFCALLSCLALAACTLGLDRGSVFSTRLATQPGTVNASEAASLISAYRRGRGLGGVTVDPTLTRIAAVHSERMAASNKMAHVLPGEGSFRQRLTAGGFNGGAAAENVAAGQDSLSEVLEAWRRSPGHNRNLLMTGVTHIGIAVAVAPESRYKTFWTLVLGAPRPVATVAIPGPGPYVAVGGGAGAEVN
jgi:uncharacterized protein YkwD